MEPKDLPLDQLAKWYLEQRGLPLILRGWERPRGQRHQQHKYEYGGWSVWHAYMRKDSPEPVCMPRSHLLRRDAKSRTEGHIQIGGEPTQWSFCCPKCREWILRDGAHGWSGLMVAIQEIESEEGVPPVPKREAF